MCGGCERPPALLLSAAELHKHFSARHSRQVNDQLRDDSYFENWRRPVRHTVLYWSTRVNVLIYVPRVSICSDEDWRILLVGCRIPPLLSKIYYSASCSSSRPPSLCLLHSPSSASLMTVCLTSSVFSLSVASTLSIFFYVSVCCFSRLFHFISLLFCLHSYPFFGFLTFLIHSHRPRNPHSGPLLTLTHTCELAPWPKIASMLPGPSSAPYLIIFERKAGWDCLLDRLLLWWHIYPRADLVLTFVSVEKKYF